MERGGEDGLYVPVIQKAGQMPQAEPGICCRSRTTRPWVYCLVLVRRTLFRPRPEAMLVESERIVTTPFSTLVRLSASAVAPSTKFT